MPFSNQVVSENRVPVRPAGAGEQQELAQRQQENLEVLRRILTDQEGPRLNSSLVQNIMGQLPQYAEQFKEQGVDFDPNWYQRHIQPGAVNAQTYGAIRNYADAMGRVPGFEQAGNFFNDNQYQIGGNMPNRQAQRYMDQDTLYRMGHNDRQVNPWAGAPEISYGAFNDIVNQGASFGGNYEGTVGGGTLDEYTPPWYQRLLSGAGQLMNDGFQELRAYHGGTPTPVSRNAAAANKVKSLSDPDLDNFEQMMQENGYDPVAVAEALLSRRRQ